MRSPDWCAWRLLALKKAVLSMEGGFILNTVFGDVSFDADAEAIAGFVCALLEATLGARRALTRQTAVPSNRAGGAVCAIALAYLVSR